MPFRHLRLPPPRPIAIAAAAGALALDFAVSQALLAARAALDGATAVPGLIDLHYVWNRGISFGLFPASGAAGRTAMTAIIACVAAGVFAFALRTARRARAAAFGLIAGGAAGNLIDRVAFGGVFDYFALHIGALPLFVCNVSDICISLGVLMFIAEDFRPRATRQGS
jgi:signal peptidase II